MVFSKNICPVIGDPRITAVAASPHPVSQLLKEGEIGVCDVQQSASNMHQFSHIDNSFHSTAWEKFQNLCRELDGNTMSTQDCSRLAQK